MMSILIQMIQSLTNYSTIILFALVLFFIFKPRLNILIFPLISDYIKKILCTRTKREILKKNKEKLENNSDYQQIQGHINFRKKASFEAYDDEEEKVPTTLHQRAFSEQAFHYKSVPGRGGGGGGGVGSSFSSTNSFFNRFRQQQAGQKNKVNGQTNEVPFQMTRRKVISPPKENDQPQQEQPQQQQKQQQQQQQQQPPTVEQQENLLKASVGQEKIEEIIKEEKSETMKQEPVLKTIKLKKTQRMINQATKKKAAVLNKESEGDKMVYKGKAEKDELDEWEGEGEGDEQDEAHLTDDDRNEEEDVEGEGEEGDPLRFIDEIQVNNRILSQHIDMVKCNVALEMAINRENYDLGRKIFLTVIQHFREDADDQVQEERKENDRHRVKSIPILTFTLYLNLLEKQLDSLQWVPQTEQVHQMNMSLKISIVNEAQNLFDQVFGNLKTKAELNNVFLNNFMKIVFYDVANITPSNVKRILDAAHQTQLLLDKVTLTIILRALTQISSDQKLTEIEMYGAVPLLIKLVHVMVEEYLLDEKEIRSYEEKYIQLFSNIAIALNKMNQQEQAFSVLRLMKKFKIKSSLMPYQVIVKTAAQMQKFKLALDIMRVVLQDKIDPTTIFFNDVMNACYKANEFSEITKIYELMTRQINCRPDVLSYSFYIRALIRMREAAEGLRFFYDLIQKPEEIHFDTIFFNNVIQDLNEMGLFKDACEVFEWLLRSDRYCPSTVTYNIMIMVYGNIKEYEKGWQLYRALKNQDYQLLPTINTYINLLQICAKTHDYNSMVSLYKEVVADIYSEHPVFGLRLNNNFFYSFIKRLTESQVLEHNSVTLEACIESLNTKNVVKPYIYVNFFDKLAKILEKEKNNYKLREFCQNMIAATFNFIKELNQEKMYLPKDLHMRLCSLGSFFESNKGGKDFSPSQSESHSPKFFFSNQNQDYQFQLNEQPCFQEKELFFD